MSLLATVSSADLPEGAQGAFEEARARLGPLDQAALAAAWSRQASLTKPPGSLGRLEDLAAQLSGIAGTCPPPRPLPAVVGVFAGDHGVVAEGVTPWPSEVTAQMVGNFLHGGAAVNVLARRVGAEVLVVDVGVAGALPAGAGLVRAKVRPGTANLAEGPAMTVEEATAALDVGAALASRLAEAGAACLLTGDMGIGNTTPSACLVAALTGLPAERVTGRGTGVDDERLARKQAVVAEAVRRLPADASALEVLASVGGLEIAALAGYVVGAAAARRPVLLDGVIAVAAALVAVALAPACRDYLVAGHRSVEPGAGAGLEHLGLTPLIDLDLRLGEGSGACLALPVLDAAASLLAEMATFEGAGVAQGPLA
ncbi:nicotinate-nucleotide--dimethylbenzimidazole phosphoribosyltransferase [Aciditerrimonas ferrireducens]|uniref:Nicotinate-nucleotide--dimethylbenzimidazole phosphoribosyltransferase n=1 Tax=Aciditerrimonas ferrireducens TaxID=667306 RepID=A0ABV6C267_9ACTN